MYIGDYLARRCVYSPDAEALVDASTEPHRRFRYRELNERADRLANWLRGEGIGHGDRVAMLAHDGIAFYDAFFALGKLGAVFVPLNRRLHAREVEDQVRRTGPKLLIHGAGDPVDGIVDRFRAAGGMPRLLPLRDESGFDLADAMAGSSAEPVTCESVTEEDTACLLFTGGTTGRPKAAQISHRQIVWNTFNSRLADVRETDRFLNIFPLFHTGGLFAFSVPLLILGGSVVQTRRFDADEALRLIDQEAVTIFAGVPTVFQMLAAADAWTDADLGSLRFSMSGGAPMPVALIRKYREDKDVVFRQGFGMTEFGPGIFSLAAEDAVRRTGSIGRPNFFVDARVADPDTGETVPSDTVGELMLRGPSATTGYFDDPEATAKAFDDDWLHTGDLAYVDDEGYFFVVGRLKEMFISGGENVYPAEVEDALYEHPAVEMCAVVGVSDERWGEVGRAFVVLKDDGTATEDELIEHVRERLARYKVPKSVVFRDRLPVSGAGKILKKELV